jgi:hypothetical protein
VRDACRQRAYGGQALLRGARALLFEVAADVTAQHEGEVAVVELTGRSAQLHADLLSVAQDGHAAHRAPVAQLVDQRAPAEAWRAFGRDLQPRGRRVFQLFGRDLQEPGSRLVALDHVAGREVDHQHAFVDVIERGANAIGAALHGALVFDVCGHRDHTADIAFDREWRESHAHPARAAVGGAALDVERDDLATIERAPQLRVVERVMIGGDELEQIVTEDTIGRLMA